VYIGTLVDRVRNVLETLRSKHGELTLAMLYNSGGLNSTSSWNLILSAPWADEMGKFDATHLVAQALHDGLDSEHQIAISRVTILRTDDDFTRDVNFLYPVSPGSKGVPVPLVTAGDVSEGGGFVLLSRAPETLIAETPPQTAH
jgi:hypothetical protein